jgi:NNP family nitrate/nitrite transporter-like MFS transporter
MKHKAIITGREKNVLLAVVAAGAAAFIVGLFIDSRRLWPALLLASFFVLTLSLGAMVFLSIHHISNAGWSAAIRRVPEAMMMYLPLGAVGLLATFFGRHEIYEWSHGLTHSSEAMKAKAAFLNSPFFYGRMAVVLAVWIVFAFLLWKESRRQDEDTVLEHTTRSKRISAVFLAVFAITFSLASFDWLMSIEAEFYSTIYAFYNFSGLFLSGIAALTLVIISLRRRGLLREINEEHLHNLGKLIFGFSTFWAYLWLSQYLLIYYANIPEETIYYIRRTSTSGWQTVFYLNLLLNWIAPFVILLPRRAKRSEGTLAFVSVVVLAGHWLDLYQMIFPATGASSIPTLIDIALVAGFLSAFALVIANRLRHVSLVPAHDPYLKESLSIPSYEAAEPSHWDKDASRALILSTTGFAITFAVWGMLGALAPRFREMYGLSAWQTSLLIAIPVLLGSIGRLPAGILADRFGGRTVFGLLLLFCLIPAIGVSFTHSYDALIGWGFFLGLAGTSFSIGVAFTSKWFSPQQQGLALGIYGMGNIGQSVAVFGAPALIALTGDWRIPFWVFGAAAGVFGLIFLLFARNAKVKAPPKKFHEYLLILKREPLAWALSLFYFLTFGGFVALSIYLPTLLKDIFGLSPTDAGARVAGFVIVATGMRPIGGWMADRFGGAQVLALVLGAIGVLALGLTSSSMLLFTFGALGTAAMLGAGNGAVFKLVPEYFPRETGTVTGLVGAAGGLGGFFPPLVLGLIHTRTGSYTSGFVLLSAFALICFAANYFIFLRREEGEREPAAG